MDVKHLRPLNETQVEESKKKHGDNGLPEPEPAKFWEEFINGFKDPLISLLMGIAVLLFIMGFSSGDIFEPIGIVVTMCIVSFVSARTAISSDKAYRKLRKSIKPDQVKVLRIIDGKESIELIPITDVVVGEMVYLQSGDKVPADGCLVDGEISVDNSSLNGETEENKKKSIEVGKIGTLPEKVTGDVITDEHSLFRGAVVTSGSGYMEVVRVGVNTEMGHMAQEMTEVEENSPLKEKMGRLAKQISTFGYIGSISIAVIYIIHYIIVAGGLGNFFAGSVTPSTTGLVVSCGLAVAGLLVSWLILAWQHKKEAETWKGAWKLNSVKEIAIVVAVMVVALGLGLLYFVNIRVLGQVISAVKLAILIAVCAIPEGLPLMIATVLMQNTKKLLDHNVLVRKAIGIETAGNVKILFSDKTGTITKGKLEVVETLLADGTDMKTKVAQRELQIGICKNSDATFDNEGKVIGGNATDKALLEFIKQDTYKELQEAADIKEVNRQEFNSAWKFSQAELEVGGECRTYYKGAPEKLLSKAKYYINSFGEKAKIDKDRADGILTHLAKRGMRTLMVAYSEKPMKSSELNNDLVVVAILGIRDDVRQEAKTAIKEVQGAGIQVVMITGDRLETASVIGEESGIVKDRESIVIDGRSPEYDREQFEKFRADKKEVIINSVGLSEFTDEEVSEMLPYIRVIARAIPTDKSRMVKIAQSLYLVTGMTGDGLNDSAALKQADVGFAMGSGTDGAKEASDIVIIDDNFMSIKDAILYGRTIFHNIMKFCKFQLTINVAAVFISAISPLIGFEEPLTVTHLLFINLIMDTLGAMMLGMEPARAHYMQEKPRDRKDNIVSKEMFFQFVFMGLYITAVGLFYLNDNLFQNMCLSGTEFRTSFVIFFIFAALWNGFNVRDEGTEILKGLKENKNFIRIWLVIAATTFALTVIPFVNTIFGFEPVNVYSWLAALILSVTVIPVDIIRKVIVNWKHKDQA